MIIFNQEKLHDLLGRLSSGFGAQPLYVVVFAATIVGIVTFLFVSYRLIKRSEERRVAATIEERNRRVMSRYQFSDAELTLLDQLSRHLNDSRKIYLLLTDPHVFSSALQRARAEGDLDRKSVLLLQRRIGVDPRQHISKLRSTADLPEGTSVILERSERTRIPGVVCGNTQQSLVVELKTAPGSVVRGATVTLYCNDSRGVFAFATEIRGLKGKQIALTHSTRLRHAQRREYFRRTISMQVVVRIEGREAKSHTTRLHDLSGGGASLANTGGFLQVGDEVSVFLTRGKDGWLPMPGVVVRLSTDGEIAHIRFGEMPEVVRDQIIRIVQAS